MAEPNDHGSPEDGASRRFRVLGATHRAYSPLYARLAERAARDHALCRPLAAARPGQRRPVLVFAAVH